MSLFREIYWKYILKNTYLRVCSKSKFIVGNNVEIKNSRIIVSKSAELVIDNDVKINNVHLSIENGKILIGKKSIIDDNNKKILIFVDNGDFIIGHHSKIATRRIWIRFGGKLTIGSYTNINEGSEIRCDDCISIGDYNQISYNVNIWDTNTHSILDRDKRRHITEEYYPFYGKELAKPITSPIIIGNDCWLGQNTTILKGSKIGNEVIIGYGCLITGKIIPDHTTVVTENKIRLIAR